MTDASWADPGHSRGAPDKQTWSARGLAAHSYDRRRCLRRVAWGRAGRGCAQRVCSTQQPPAAGTVLRGPHWTDSAPPWGRPHAAGHARSTLPTPQTGTDLETMEKGCNKQCDYNSNLFINHLWKLTKIKNSLSILKFTNLLKTISFVLKSNSWSSQS